MKFLKQALAIALMSFTSVEAKKTFTRQDFADAVAAGRIDQQRLLKNAIPYNQALRRRAEGDDEDQDGDGQEDNQDQQYDDGYERVELTSNFRLQFNSCLTMETENYNLMLDNLVQYTKAGTLKSVRNYILFDVCDGDNCQAETWMVDLLTFIEAVVEYGPSRKDTVCQACATYGDEVCGTTYYYNNGYNDGNNNGGRKLQVDYQVFDESMCDECDAQKCWYDGEGDQQMDFASIEGWITEIAECKLNDQQWNGLNTYAGWMCNADGSGIQVGVFLDEYCRMYQSNLQYTSVMENDEYQYFFQSQDVIPYMFTDIIECTDQSYVQYVSEDELADIEAAGGYYSYQDGYGGISAACYSLFYSDFVPRQVGNCGDETDLTDEQLAQQQQMYENYYNNGQNMYQYVQAQQMMYNDYGQDTSWYNYDLDAFQVLDGAAVCNAIDKKWTNAGYATGYSALQNAANPNSQTNIDNAFNDEHTSSGFWKWGNGKSAASSSSSDKDDDSHWLFPTRNNNSKFQTADAKFSPFEICWIVLLSVGATAAFLHFTRRQVIKRRNKKLEVEKEVYVRTDTNGSPLIIS